MKFLRLVFCSASVTMAIVCAGGRAMALCPMCTSAVEGSTRAAEFTGSLTAASLLLLAPPLIIFVGLFGLFYRLRDVRNPAESPEQCSAHADSPSPVGCFD